MNKRANILITGASTGLGAGMERKFAERRRNLAVRAEENNSSSYAPNCSALTSASTSRSRNWT